MKAEDDDSSESDTDCAFRDDMEALKRACLITGTDPSNLQLVPACNDADKEVSCGGFSRGDSASDDAEDDFQFVRNIKKRFDLLNDTDGEPVSDEPVYSIPPVSSENDKDDFETLRAIQRRFAAYGDDNTQESIEKAVSKTEQVGVTNIDSEKETSSNCFVESSNAWEGFPDCVDKSSSSTQSLEACNTTEFIDRQNADADDLTIGPVKGTCFPKSAQAFVDAIKKNRSCQQLIRNNLMHIKARIEEVKMLKDRVKILKDFQVSCKARTGRALSQKKDGRIQLISARNPRTHSKVNGKLSAMNYGPAENSQVAAFREALKKFPVCSRQEKWSDKDKKNLAKGVRQQLQEMLLQRSLDLASNADGSLDEFPNLDNIISSISDHDITPENIRAFLPLVNWDYLASMHVSNRSGAECQARWLNFEDSLINHSPWSTGEDKNLLLVIQQKGLNNWIDIAVSLGTNRTPFQCLVRYQRSLNASLIKREWSKEEDDQLRAAVEAFGESDWQTVASSMEGRTGTQCSNRWNKTLHPSRKRVGHWTYEEDNRLKVAVMLFGPKTWTKVAESIPGRTHVQCRERYVNSLDPSLNLKQWTEEEDLRLKDAIAEHGYCWSKVSTCVPARTDNHCARRWKVLFPHDVPLLQAARKIEKAALVSNFVDRESERSNLGPGDFAPPSEMNLSQLEWIDDSAAAVALKSDLCNEEAPRSTNGTRPANSTRNKKRKAPIRKKRDTVDSMYMYNEKEFKLIDEEEPDTGAFPSSSHSDVNLPNGKEVGKKNNENTNTHKRASKLQPRRRKCLDKRDALPLPSSSHSDASLPNGKEVDRNNENTNTHKRASKPQPKRRKCLLDKRKKIVVANDECLPSPEYYDPSFLFMERNANDSVRNDDVAENSLPNQIETNVASKKKEAKIGSKRKLRNIIPKSSLTSECNPKSVVIDSKPAQCGNVAKPSGKRHRNCLSPIRSSAAAAAAGIVENETSKTSSAAASGIVENETSKMSSAAVASDIVENQTSRTLSAKGIIENGTSKASSASGIVEVSSASGIVENGTSKESSASGIVDYETSKASSASGIVENRISQVEYCWPQERKRSRRLQARDYLNKMMEEDDDISLASYIKHIKRTKRKQVQQCTGNGTGNGTTSFVPHRSVKL